MKATKLLCLKFFFEDISPFWGQLIPLFQTTGDVSSGFQSQGGSCHLHATCDGILRFTSSVTPAGLLVVGGTAELISATYLQAGIG